MGVLALAILVAVVSGCKKDQIETVNNEKSTAISHYEGDTNRDLVDTCLFSYDTIPPMISSNLPVFPCEVLFVVNKEYELVVEGRSEKTVYQNREILSYTQPDYVELRLIELFPDLAYIGVMEDSQNFYDSVSAVYDTYLNNILIVDERGSEVPYGDIEELPYISDENEMVVLEMTEAEKECFLQYIKIAGMDKFATLEDIYKVGGKDQIFKATNFNWVLFGCICALVVEYGSYVYNRALLCRDRATLKTEEYYHGNSGAGKKGDAYRHVSVSMLLRYYLSEFKSYLIMDIAWERFLGSSEPPCDTHMDIHNNYVGRHGKYYYFRVGPYWEEWMINTKDFINDNDNASLKNWDASTSWWKAFWQRICTSGSKYIYYKS